MLFVIFTDVARTKVSEYAKCIDLLIHLLNIYLEK